MGNPVTAALLTYLQDQSSQRFQELRSAVAASPDYDPYCSVVRDSIALMDGEKFDEAADTLRRGMRMYLLNPRIHFLLSFCFHKLGDESGADMEWRLGSALLEGILASGDGSEGRPYCVSCITDEYDVLEKQERELKSQALVHGDDAERGSMDCLTCTDGTALWFDISMQFARLNSQSGGMPGAGDTTRPWWRFWSRN